MIDSHSHIYCDAFDTDREEMLLRAREAGVTHIVMPNENLESISRLKAVYDAHPQFVSMTIGCTPKKSATTTTSSCRPCTKCLPRALCSSWLWAR